MEQVLQNINRLNRNLESIIAVSSIETNGSLKSVNNVIHRSAMSSVPSKLSGHNLRTSWTALKIMSRKGRDRVKGNMMERKEGMVMIKVSTRENQEVTSDVSTRCLAYDDRSLLRTMYLFSWVASSAI